MSADHAPRRFGTVNETTWPVNLTSTEDRDGVEWLLRYAPERLTREDQLVLAAVVAAYVYLTNPDLSQKDAREALTRARLAAIGARHGID